MAAIGLLAPRWRGSL
ncbi:hypothetical protein [Caulobacter sp. BE264]|nr:hypothetical protein [Caulobacter sp. BE264]